MKRVDLIISGGILVTMNSGRDILSSSSIIIDGGKIVEIAPYSEVIGKYTSDNIIDASNCIVMPGLINTHTHSPLTFFRGISDDLELMEWLKRYIWPLEEKFISKDFVRLSTRLAIHEMVLSGTTTFNDSYFFSREVAEVAKSMGVRCIAGEIILDFPTPSHKNSEDALSYIKENLQEYRNDDLISISAAPHSLYACSKEVILKANNLIKDYKSLINIHISESEKEFSDIQQQYGLTPVGLLKEWNILSKNLIAAHCVYLDQKDIGYLVESEVGISHNPESNMKLGNGIAPISELIRKNGIVGLGTDGAASNNDLSLLGEVDTAAKLQKGFYKDSTLMRSEEAVEMLTIQGAKALNLDDKIGSIEAGKQADVILINLDRPHLTPLYDPYSHIVYAASAGDVKKVIIDGKLIADEGKIIKHDVNEIMGIVKEYSFKIMEYLNLPIYK